MLMRKQLMDVGLDIMTLQWQQCYCPSGEVVSESLMGSAQPGMCGWCAMM